MRSLVLLCLLQLYCVVGAFSGYHEAIGIPTARTLMQLEIAPRIIGGSQVPAISNYPFQMYSRDRICPTSFEPILGSYILELEAWWTCGAGIITTLTSGKTSLCGGALVSTKRVVTAAHCWNDGQSQARQFTVVLGTLTVFSGGTRITTSDVTVHPQWSPKSIHSDIAIVKFSAIKLNNNIQLIPLPATADARETFAGLSSIASGYGKTSDSQTSFPPSTTLYHINLNIITNAVCQKSFEVKLESSHLCTSGTSGVGTCDGDSGGPLTVIWKNKRILVGIVSFGFGDKCSAGYPSVYTRVTSFLTWLQAQM